jgi:hypothetical protein
MIASLFRQPKNGLFVECVGANTWPILYGGKRTTNRVLERVNCGPKATRTNHAHFIHRRHRTDFHRHRATTAAKRTSGDALQSRPITQSLTGRCAVIQGDRNDYASFEETFRDRTFDVAVDMVSFHPDATASAIRAFNGRVGQFIHCSTVCVYSGPVQQIPTTETEPYHSIGSYGQNKIACEELLLSAWRNEQFPVTIMRPSHSYGEGGDLIRSFGPSQTFVTGFVKASR